MFLLGLTGDIACGKSTVARWLVERGAAHIDSDLLVRELYQSATFARDLAMHLKQNAGSGEDRVLDVLADDLTIDRAALAQWVLVDDERLIALERFVHPAVARLRQVKIDELRGSDAPPQVAVLEAVKLVESGQARICNAIWWITCSPEVQLRRLTEDRGLSPQDAALRLEHQPDEDQKRALIAELEIPLQIFDNSLSRADLEAQLSLSWYDLIRQIGSD